MNTVYIYQLHPSQTLFGRLKAAQMEAASVWNTCCELHKAARKAHLQWPGQNELHHATKQRFALHSQSVQAVFRAFLANIDTTRQLRRTHPNLRMKYPWRTKRFYPVHWPAQAVSKEQGRVVLPMGRGRKSLVLPLELPERSGACTLIWNRGFELHVCVHAPDADAPPGTGQAAVDLGEIHLAAVTTNSGQGLIVTGRGIRSLKRQRTKQARQISKKQSHCTKHSRRWKKLQRTKNRAYKRAKQRIRDLRHKATHAVVDYCVRRTVGSLFIGNPRGVRTHSRGRYHNQRLMLWEYGKDIDYLTYKCKNAHIMCFTGSERGTSSQCPRCGHRQKPRNRNWACSACGFSGHRDLVGSVNMHVIAYGSHVPFPRSITYLRPGPSRRSSRADTPQCCLSELTGQPLLDEQVS